jgi:restriction endonuclease S subunit
MVVSYNIKLELRTGCVGCIKLCNYRGGSVNPTVKQDEGYIYPCNYYAKNYKTKKNN